VDPGKERFGLTWPGKADLMRTIQQPSVGTLRPMRGESVDFDATQNMIIEGDNLEVLKLLQKSYHGKVKLIYIDPPYNTGNEFIYPDNFREGLQDYLRYSGQVDGDGLRLSTNSESDGRYHSNWLNMMYPRLFLARNLLRDDGAIFVSVDDSEVHNLRALMNEIFGEECFVGQIVRATGTTTGQDAGGFGKSFDYIIGYARDTDFELGGIPLDEGDEQRFSGVDDKGNYGVLQLRKTGNADRREDRPTMYYGIAAPDGAVVYPIGPGGYQSRWRFGPDRYAEYEGSGFIEWKQVDRNGTQVWSPYVKFYLEGRTKRPSPLWNDIDGNKKATIEVKSLLGERIFDNPKPTELVRRLLQISQVNSPSDLVLDFFAGSGTTGDAVLRMNAIDSNRRFILVQLPEPTAGPYPTIAAITRERVRRAGKAIVAERAGKLDLDGRADLDLGFRAYKLTTSNFKPWDGDPARFSADGQQQGLFAPVARQLEMAADNVLPGRSADDLLAEVLLRSGFELTAPVERLTLAGAAVFSVAEGSLLVCLERALTIEAIEAMAARDPAQIVCLETGFGGNDALKVNAVQAIKARGVELRVV